MPKKKSFEVKSEYQSMRDCDLPTEYFKTDFRLPNGFFEMKSHQDAQTRNEDLSNALDQVEGYLTANISKNFDFFTQSFEHLNCIEEDIQDVKVEVAKMKSKHLNVREQIK